MSADVGVSAAEIAALLAAQDDCLIAITDGHPLPARALGQLPPWRAVLIARVAARAGIGIERGTLDQLVAEARGVGGDGTLGEWWTPAPAPPAPAGPREGRPVTADMATLIAHRFDAMTLGEATRLLRAEPWACACIGDPYCCRHGFDHARRLQRAAHIVARQLADDVARARRYMFPPDIRAALSCTCTFNMSTGKWEPPPGGCPAGHSGPW